MQFDSLAAALEMGGHGVYVWTVVSVTLLIVVGLLMLPTLASRRFLAEQRGILRREQRSAAQADTPMRDRGRSDSSDDNSNNTCSNDSNDKEAPLARIEEVNHAPRA